MKPSHGDWYRAVMKLKADLESSPSDIELAQRLWEAVGGGTGYDIRSGRLAVSTFRGSALLHDEGLCQLLLAFRQLAGDAMEYPTAELFDPPLENRLRSVAAQSGHVSCADANWMLGFFEDEQ